EDVALPGDRADQDRPGRDLGSREGDALAQLRPVADARAVAEHDRARQAHARPDAHLAADPGGALDVGVRAQRDAVGPPPAAAPGAAAAAARPRWASTSPEITRKD